MVKVRCDAESLLYRREAWFNGIHEMWHHLSRSFVMIWTVEMGQGVLLCRYPHKTSHAPSPCYVRFLAL